LALRFVAEARDPVHGYVRMTEVEREIIDSPFLQRLRRIHQLAGSYVVYPGATHTRFEHVVGSMHVAGLIAESLVRHSDIAEENVQELRLAALLHDVGHGPFSHMYEEVLSEKSETSHEDISQRIITGTSIRDVLSKNGFSARKMSRLAVGRQRSGEPFFNEVIAGSLSADMMDYLPRDSYFAGVEYGRVDAQRVIDSLHAVDGHLVIDDAALNAFEALILARYEMFKAVYFHRTVRAAEIMLVRSMKLADGALRLTDLTNLDTYLELTDEVVLHELVTLKPSSPELKEARRLAVGFRDRRLVKCAFERLVQRKEKAVGKLFADEAVRNRAVADMAGDARVRPDQVYLDVPTTPSVPYTYSREPPTVVGLMKAEGSRRVMKVVPIKDLPLVGSIEGYMDMIRVYTTTEHRSAVAKAASNIFTDLGPTPDFARDRS
jgi:HD superfamily phosphohydrolase